MPAGFAVEVAAAAARLIVEEGLEYGPAKLRAARDLGRPRARNAELPNNQAVENEVRSYLALYRADSQPEELAALRTLAKTWMLLLGEFRPHLAGAVWRGTATRHNDVHLHLYCDDSKSAEIALLNMGVDYRVGAAPGPRGVPVDVLSFAAPCPDLGGPVALHLTVLDHDDLRGALRPDSSGMAARGDLAALCRLEAAA